MSKTVVPQQEYDRMKSTLLNGLDIQYTRTVYVLRERTPSDRAYMRFFLITGPGEGITPASFTPRIIEITRYVGKLTKYPMKERRGVFYVHTHSTNASDVVRSLSKELFGSETKLSAELL